MLSIPFWSDFILFLQALSFLKEYVFQSHFGLILSYSKVLFQDLKTLSFNPILVWFYREWKKVADVHDNALTFNPILVWFYQSLAFTRRWKSWSLSIPFWSDFIFVGCLYYIIKLFTFQSHFGLILSLNILSYKIITWKLSIPFWSDFILDILY